MNQRVRSPEVLTLHEVADYLRLSESVVERQAVYGEMPGRRIENTWRFLRTAIDEWLRGYDGRQVLLQQAGMFQDDDALPEILERVYARRGRPMTEDPGE